MESEWKGGCQGLGRGRNEEILINGHRASIKQNEQIIEMFCITWYLKLILYHAFKNVLSVDLM